MAPTHECPAPDCAAQVPQSQFACRPHWYSIPVEIRSRIWSGYRDDDLERHSQAMEDAISYLETRAESKKAL